MKPDFLSHDSGSNPPLPPQQDPEALTGGAPAGRFFGDDLPVTAVPGGTPYTVGGFSPSPTNPEMPTEAYDGFTTPPTGVRR